MMFEMIVDNIPEAVIVADPLLDLNGLILQTNPAYEAMTGYGQAELSGSFTVESHPMEKTLVRVVIPRKELPDQIEYIQ
jgi:PAS domain S-box-containing protein